MVNHFNRVYTKARKRWGTVYPAVETEYWAAVVPGKSINIYKNGEFGRSNFKIGDTAEYDSYNLNYLGEITAIGKKTVTITAYKGTNNARNHRLDLNTFCWRNCGIDIAKVSKANAETMMYI